MKYLALFREKFKSRVAFRIGDVNKVLSETGITKRYTYTLLSHLIKKGEIKKIRRGVYTFREEMQIVGFAYSPFYYGLQEALSLRKLWEQETNPVVITPRRIGNGVLKFLGNNYLVKRIDRKLFFGFELIKYYDLWVPVSDVEKTIIDFVYFRQRIPKETMEELKNKTRKDVLANYLKRVPQWLKKRVMIKLR